MGIVRPTQTVQWTNERISALTTAEVQQLRANAERLNHPEIRERCDAVLSARRREASAKAKALRAEQKKPQETGGAA